MPTQPDSSELESVDDTIDAIAREALEEARRMEEARTEEARRAEETERYRNNPGPIVGPQKPVGAA